MRNFRARMRLMRPGARNGRRACPEPPRLPGRGDGRDDKKQPSLAAGDPIACDALAAAALENPGAPFAPDVISELATLKRADRFQFETLRTRLKKAGCRVTELDGLIAKEGGERRDGRPPSQADILVALAEAAELFHTPDEVAYADIEINGHRETWPVQSRGFRRWLKRRYFEEQESAPNGEAVATALGVIEAKAQHDTPVREVFVRVGELDGKIYLDLCDAEWRAVEIDKTGWRVVDRPDVRFRRTPDMRPLPDSRERRLGRRPAAIAQYSSPTRSERRATTTSSWRSPMSWPACAGAAPTRSWRSAASRAARSRPARRCCAA